MVDKICQILKKQWIGKRITECTIEYFSDEHRYGAAIHIGAYLARNIFQMRCFEGLNRAVRLQICLYFDVHQGLEDTCRKSPCLAMQPVYHECKTTLVHGVEMENGSFVGVLSQVEHYCFGQDLHSI